MFQAPFSFDGRIRRLEYGLTRIITYATVFIIAFASESMGSAGSVLLLIVFIPLIWLNLAQNTKRSHDVGKSGWWQLVPFFGLFLLFQDGDFGINEYGQNPKGLGNEQVMESETLDGHMRL